MTLSSHFDHLVLIPPAPQAQFNNATGPMQKFAAGVKMGYADGVPVDIRATLKAFPMTLTSVQQFAESLPVMA